ncbi:MAG: signal peptidase I [Deinococcales bacterium]
MSAPSRLRRPTAQRWLTLLLAVALAGLLLGIFVFGVARVDGHSMQPTLHDGDRVLVLRTGAWLHRLGVGRYRAGDIVTFPDPTRHVGGLRGLLGGHLLIKRIVAGPGRRVALDDGRLVVDGRRQPEPYLAHAFRGSGSIPALRVPPGHVYVMGDNRHPLASFDSRSYGPVPTDTILGRAVLVVWPLVRRGPGGWFFNVRLLTAGSDAPAMPSSASR